MSNPFLEIVADGLQYTLHKWVHYFPIYERYFQLLKGRTVRILEIGVQNGGSLELWNRYFEGDCEIYGLDIDPNCLQFGTDKIHIIIGDQKDRAFLTTLTQLYDKFDIVIDDGGHRMEEQITTFEVLYPHVKAGGIYICEDTHTSYMPVYGGAPSPDLPAFQTTFLAYALNLVHDLHFHHMGHQRTPFNLTCRSICFYDSMVVFTKEDGLIQEPKSVIYKQESPVDPI